MPIISSAKVGAWLTSSRKSFFEIGITAVSVFAVAVALRARNHQRHLAENVIGFERGKQAIAKLDVHLPALDDIELFRRFAFLEDRFARLEYQIGIFDSARKLKPMTSSDMGASPATRT